METNARAEQIVSRFWNNQSQSFDKVVALIAEAIKDEREACAKVADGFYFSDGDYQVEIAEAIRARK